MGAPGSAAVARGSAFLGLWVVIAGFDLAGVLVGLATAAAATWASLRLLPSGAARLRPLPLAVLSLRLIWQSLVAGVDVARRAFDPGLPLRPGFVSCPLPGPFRQAFAAMASLVPGTLPAGAQASTLLVHCLDARPEVATQLAADEARLTRVLGRGG
jgi:multicomponent Na+:H+ antiporter subunit E